MKNNVNSSSFRFSVLMVMALFVFSNCKGPSHDNISQDNGLQASSFFSPPNSAKPRVWWHWMNGNITKEGITKDLEWMQSIGIGGFQNFDANLFTPDVVENKLVFMTPKWKDAFRHATEQAIERGLEIAIAGSPGWSVTGGPWVTPEDGMKKFVWTESRISGGNNFNNKLPQPSANIGKFQNTRIHGGGISSGFVGEQPIYYKDAAVIAFRLTDEDYLFTDLNPMVTSSNGSFQIAQLSDYDLDSTVFLPPSEVGEDMWIQYSFKTPQTFKAFSVSGASQDMMAEFTGAPENRSLKISNDGINFREIAKISGSTVPFNTVAIPATKARFWRLCFKTLPPQVNAFAALAGLPPGGQEPDGVHVAEFILYTTARIDQIEDKAGFSAWAETESIKSNSESDIIALEDIVVLTDKMDRDGTLNWDVPDGQWSVIRLGYSLTGRQNHPASPEATGLEVDKLDKDAVRRYINTYLDMYEDATGGKMGKAGLEYIILDSYEAGHMNWTANLSEEFEKRRGYDLIPWIPALIGRVVKDDVSSEKFLWDFRKTIGEMIADNHYDVIGEELHQRGMGRYTESHENRRIFLADGMDVKRHADIPMSAMWTPNTVQGLTDEEPRSEADIRESASVTNIYGKPIVAAESMTALMNGFAFDPERLKRTADLELASGLNRFVIHTSVHQPLDDKKPGFSLGPFGQYFTRHETWAAYAKPWVDYLARSSYMFQQGRNVADILYYYGENNNVTWICKDQLPEISEGYEFDFVNATALLNAMSAENGKLIAQSGNTYKVLMLDQSAIYMTLPVLKKLHEFYRAGVKILGERPEKSPSLADDDDVAFQQIADEIWYLERPAPFEALGLQPDIIISNTDHDIRFRHRKTLDKDIYWLNNRSEDPTDVDISFRINGKVPMLWDPQTGKLEKLSYEIENDRTMISFEMESWGAFFIVFSGTATPGKYIVPQVTDSEILDISGPWDVTIGDHEIKMDSLSSFTNYKEPNIKYFSGTASYKTSISINELSENSNYIIDLGQVENLAEVVVNGQNIGIIWKTPFRIDITDPLKVGKNDLEINVTNLWVNRLIGDAQPDALKNTFTTIPFYQADGQLLPSGLLGPVQLLGREN